MWIRLVKKYPIHIIQEDLVAHLRDGNNTSAVSPENSARNLTELVEIFGSFFEGLSDEIFAEGFASDFRLIGVPATPTRLRCENFSCCWIAPLLMHQAGPLRSLCLLEISPILSLNGL